MTTPDDPAAVLTRLLHAVDALHWARVRDCVADQLELDYTELFGGEPQLVTGDQLVAGWQSLLPGFDATHHMTGPVLTEPANGGGADGDLPLRAQVRGLHQLAGAEGGDLWDVYGQYEVRLTKADGGWRISRLVLHLIHQAGNTGLPELAVARAATSPRAPRPELA